MSADILYFRRPTIVPFPRAWEPSVGQHVEWDGRCARVLIVGRRFREAQIEYLAPSGCVVRTWVPLSALRPARTAGDRPSDSPNDGDAA